MLARHVRSVLLGAAIAVLLSEFVQYANTVVLPAAAPNNSPPTSVGNGAIPTLATQAALEALLKSPADNQSFQLLNREMMLGSQWGSWLDSSPLLGGHDRIWSSPVPPVPHKAPPLLDRQLLHPSADGPSEPVPKLNSTTFQEARLVQAALPPQIALPAPLLLLSPLPPPTVPLLSSRAPSWLVPAAATRKSFVTTITSSEFRAPAPPYVCAHGPVAFYTAMPNSQVLVGHASRNLASRPKWPL